MQDHNEKCAAFDAAELLSPDQLLNSDALAAWLGMSKEWTRQARRRGHGPPFIRIGPRCIRYRVGDVLEWLQGRKQHSNKPKPRFRRRLPR